MRGCGFDLSDTLQIGTFDARIFYQVIACQMPYNLDNFIYSHIVLAVYNYFSVSCDIPLVQCLLEM